MTDGTSSATSSEGVIDVYGSLLKLDPGDSLFLGSHDYEPYESKLMMGLLRPGDVAVDVGAMIGYYTVIFARYVGSQGRVYAFEPDPENHALLQENLQMNGYENVRTGNALVGAAAGRGRLWRSTANRGDHRAFPTEGRTALDVDVVALDEAIDEPVDLIKIDAQGSEAAVVEGMTDLIGRSPQLAMMIEFCPALLTEAGTDPGNFVDGLRRRFALYEITDEGVAGTDTRALLEHVRPESGDAAEGYTNLLCVKEQP